MKLPNAVTSDFGSCVGSDFGRCSSKVGIARTTTDGVVDEELASAGVAGSGLKQLDEIRVQVIVWLQQKRGVWGCRELHVEVIWGGFS